MAVDELSLLQQLLVCTTKGRKLLPLMLALKIKVYSDDYKSTTLDSRSFDDYRHALSRQITPKMTIELIICVLEYSKPSTDYAYNTETHFHIPGSKY